MLFRNEDDEVMPFRDRSEAGMLLATKLSDYAGRRDVIVLGLPRGGVDVAFQVARTLKLPMDVLVVRKLGLPWQKELAMGAIGPRGVQVLNERLTEEMGLPEEVIQSVAAAESQELAAQEQRYRGDRQPLELANRTVILVDDGIATGCSIRAAVASARQQHAARVVVAVPVAAVAACDLIAREADEVVCVAEPEELFAISQWYEDFHQSSDEDVRSLLEEADRLTLCKRFRRQ